MIRLLLLMRHAFVRYFHNVTEMWMMDEDARATKAYTKSKSKGFFYTQKCVIADVRAQHVEFPYTFLEFRVVDGGWGIFTWWKNFLDMKVVLIQRVSSSNIKTCIRLHSTSRSYLSIYLSSLLLFNFYLLNFNNLLLRLFNFVVTPSVLLD